MNETSDDDSDADAQALANSAGHVVWIALVFAIVVVTVFAMNFSNAAVSKDPGSWGQFGDYVGGLINPFVGLITVYLIFTSITIQRKELKNSLKELKQANESSKLLSFEQTFFAWLGNYSALLNSIEDQNGRGRDVLERWYTRSLTMTAIISKVPGATTVNGVYRWLDDEWRTIEAGGSPDRVQDIFDHLMKQYDSLYKDHRSDFDALYRTLYRLLLWIDNSKLDLPTRWQYISIVRAQLSWIECVLLLFNGLTMQGQKFCALANKYALFDNLELSNSILRMIAYKLPLYPPEQFQSVDRSWPYKETAFSSDKARAAAPVSIPALKVLPD